MTTAELSNPRALGEATTMVAKYLVYLETVSLIPGFAPHFLLKSNTSRPLYLPMLDIERCRYRTVQKALKGHNL